MIFKSPLPLKYIDTFKQEKRS